jgi:hypothetical protein
MVVAVDQIRRLERGHRGQSRAVSRCSAGNAAG